MVTPDLVIHDGNLDSAAPRGERIIALCGSDASPQLVSKALSHTEYDAHVVSSVAELHRSLTAMLSDAHGTVVVMPMTSGRNLTLISDAARACRWAARNYPDAGLCLADAPLSTTTTLAWLRQGLRKHTSDTTIAILTSAAIDPFSDAELFRIARLAWTNSSGATVAVAFDDVFPSVDETTALYSGAKPNAQFAIIRADLHMSEGQYPLISPAALGAAIAASARRAVHLLNSHRDNGIDRSLLADHEHGYAHSHGDDNGHSHSHLREHSHSHHHHHNHADSDTLHIHLGGDHA